VIDFWRGSRWTLEFHVGNHELLDLGDEIEELDEAVGFDAATVEMDLF
jgi:hypothetical protein